MMLAFDVPVWGQVLIAIAAVAGAARFLWTEVLHPAARLVSTSDIMIPLLVELTNEFRDQPHAFATLGNIAAQFGPGSNLHDVVNRLERAVLETHHTSERFKASLDLARVLAERDREAVQQLIILLERLTIRVQRLEDQRAGLPPTAPRPSAPMAPARPPRPAVESPVPESAADDAASSLWDGLERRMADDADYDGPERRAP